MDLESILLKHFKCKNPFLKRKRLCGYFFGEPDYEHLTKAGGRVYRKLTDLIYDLEELLGNSFDAHNLISILDEIIREER